MYNIIDFNLVKIYILVMENKALIGKTIRDKRIYLNLTMDQVAAKAKITRATLLSIENGTGNYTIDSLLAVMDILSLPFCIKGAKPSELNKKRAKRINTAEDKKINRFIIMCLEQYCSSVGKSSVEIYKDASKKGILKLLTDQYELLHGMSTGYLNDLIGQILGN